MAGSISGQVTDPRPTASANPAISGAQVTVTDGQGAAQSSTTGSDGKYTITNLTAGQYQVNVTAPPGFLDLRPPNPVTVVEGQDTPGNFSLTAGSITGRVTDQKGNAVPTVPQRQVQVKDGKNNVVGVPLNIDAQGYYTFPVLAAGKYTVEVLDVKDQPSYAPPAYNVEVMNQITAQGIDFSEDVVKDFLDRLDDARFNIESPVSKEEARQAISLFSVVNLMLAGLSRRRVGSEDKMDMLGTLGLYYGLQDGSVKDSLVVSDSTALWSNLEDEIKSLAKDLDQLQSDVDFLNREAKRQFNLGTSNNVLANVQFPALFKRYVEIGSDPLLSFDIKVEARNQFSDKTKLAQADDLLKELKSVILQMVRSLSKYGTAATKRVNEDWSEFELRACEALQIVARDRQSPDADEKNVWSVLAALTGKNRETEIAPYVVLARHGAKLLQFAYDAYVKMENNAQIDRYDSDHLRGLFQEGTDPTKYLTEKIRAQATVVKRYPPANWG